MNCCIRSLRSPKKRKNYKPIYLNPSDKAFYDSIKVCLAKLQEHHQELEHHHKPY